MTRVYTEEVGSAGSPTPLRTIRARGVDCRLRALKPEILALVKSILDSGVIEKGPHIAALAREFQELCHAHAMRNEVVGERKALPPGEKLPKLEFAPLSGSSHRERRSKTSSR